MKLNLLITTDIHGHIFPSDYRSQTNDKNYGLARIATAIKKFKEKENVLIIDNGDAIQGTPLLTYANQNINTYQNPMAKAFNLLGYNYINLGNHDFNYGSHVLHKYIKENNAKLLTTNLTINGEKPGQTQIIKIENKKIALIGALTQYIPNWENPDDIKNMTFKSAYSHIKQEVKRIKDKVDIIIAVYHGGMEKDLETNIPTEKLTGKNEGSEISTIKELDILITGHQHRSINQYVNGTYITQTNKNATEFITLSIDLNTKEITSQIHQSKDYKIDKTFLNYFKDIEQDTQNWLDEPIGKLIDGDLLVKDVKKARLYKHPIVSLINQIQQDYTQADFSSFALFDDIVGLNETITMRDIVNTYPYPNSLVLKEVTGHDIKAMLEHSASYYMVENDEIIINPRYIYPKPQHYNYEMMDGLDYTINASNERGSKISKMMRHGKPFNLDKTYTLVVNNYRAQGGGHYEMIKNAKTIQEFPLQVMDVIYEYIKKKVHIKVNHRNNITIEM